MAKAQRNDGIARKRQLNIRLTDGEFEAISKAAAELGITASEWVRRKCLWRYVTTAP